MALEIPAPGDGGDIIIKGSSCEIEFNDRHFQRDENEALLARHTRNDLRITRIVINGDASFYQDFTEGFKGEIIVSYEP